MSSAGFLINGRTVSLLTLRRLVALARRDLRAGVAFDLDADGAEAAVARLVGRVVAEAVELADLFGHLREGAAGVAQVGRGEGAPARVARQLLHLRARHLVEGAADVHPLERPHLAEVR